MGCPKHLYNPDQESSPFLEVWKKERLENADTHFLGTLEEKSRAENFCNSYLPFGLTFNSSAISPENKYRFQGQEHQDETGWDQFKWRNSDPALGRFFNVDPLAEDYYYNSPYAFSENKVTSYIELEGLEALFALEGQKMTGKGWNDPNNKSSTQVEKPNNQDIDWHDNSIPLDERLQDQANQSMYLPDFVVGRAGILLDEVIYQSQQGEGGTQKSGLVLDGPAGADPTKQIATEGREHSEVPYTNVADKFGGTKNGWEALVQAGLRVIGGILGDQEYNYSDTLNQIQNNGDTVLIKRNEINGIIGIKKSDSESLNNYKLEDTRQQ